MSVEAEDRWRTREAMRLCEADGCDRPVSRSAHWCRGHAARVARGADLSAPLQARDGRRAHPLYTLWTNMRRRCRTEPAYVRRGITVCAEWATDPLAFYTWVEANLGPRPEGHSLDRIDNDGNYEPGNVRWADDMTQAQNSSGWDRLSPKNVYPHGPGFRAIIVRAGTTWRSPTYRTESEAITARDAYLASLETPCPSL